MPTAATLVVSGPGSRVDGLVPPEPAAAAPPVALDRRDLEALIPEYIPGLRARAVQLCRDHMDPDDLLQEALERACRRLDTIRDRERLRAWLLTIVSNTFIDLIRKRRARPQTVPFDPGTDAADNVDDALAAPLPWDHITTAQLHAAIERLPDDIRETYKLRSLEGMDYHAIAKALEIPRSTVGTRLVRARKRLRELLSADVEDTQ